MIRSLYAKILLGFALIFVLTLVCFAATLGLIMANRGIMSPEFPSRTAAVHLALAQEALEEGGPSRLAQFLGHLDNAYGVEHFLVNAEGKDLVDGNDRANLLRQSRPTFYPKGGVTVVGKWSTDGKQVLLILLSPPGLPTDLLYFFWIPVAVTFACFVLAYQLIQPLRRVRDVVARFGKGELAARVGLNRRDEIGEVAAEFDRMAERIEQLLLAERRLLQDVSHELRSPLARLALAAELAEKGNQPQAAFTRVRKEIQRLTDLVAELIELTRVEGDPNSAPHESLCLTTLVRDVLADNVDETLSGGRRLDAHLVEAVRVKGRAPLLRRAIENVLDNALRFAPENTTIDVGLSDQEGLAELTIRDRGPGVPEELKEAIFKPFFRVETDRNRLAGGIGLGLSIARRAVTFCGGQITARNAGPGLEVKISLPGGNPVRQGSQPPSSPRSS